jgi:hypothetical protein
LGTIRKPVDGHPRASITEDRWLLGDCSNLWAIPKMMGMMGLTQIRHGMDHPFSQGWHCLAQPLVGKRGDDKAKDVSHKMLDNSTIIHVLSINKTKRNQIISERLMPHGVKPPHHRSPTTEFQSGSIHPVTSHPNRPFSKKAPKGPDGKGETKHPANCSHRMNAYQP